MYESIILCTAQFFKSRDRNGQSYAYVHDIVDSVAPPHYSKVLF